MNADLQNPPTLVIPSLTDEELFDALERCHPSHLDGQRVTKHNLNLDMPFFVHYMGGKPAATDAVWTVRSDASYFRTPKVGVVAWQVHRPGRDYKPKVVVRRRFDGASAMTEVIGACCALQQALDLGARHVVLKTDNQNVVKYLADVWHTSAASYAKPHRDRLEALAACFDSVQLVWVRTKPTLKDLDNLARSTARAAIKAINASWEGYVAKLDTKMKLPVQRAVINGMKFYDGFPASANPPLCTCYCWEQATIKALMKNPRNRPKRVCKHLAAAFAEAGATGAQMADFLRDYYAAIRRQQPPPPFPVQPPTAPPMEQPLVRPARRLDGMAG